jgi:hypothetical protein
MVIEAAAAKRSKVHTRYYTKAGVLVPGVTTVLGVLNKPALVSWANNLGLNGIAVREYVDVLAEIGTIAHAMILAHHKNEKFDTTNIPADLIDKAENCLISYFNWEKGHKVEPVLCEQRIVSEDFAFGGTLDLLAKVDGVLTLLDYKTGRGIYPEHFYQMAAYRVLSQEAGYHPAAVRILQVGRSEDEGFSEQTLEDTSKEWEIFKHCLGIYRLQKIKRAA